MALFSGSLALLFFISGASALIYQVLWLRMLGLVFGVTIHAATTVLASFMGGLAVGSLLAGRLAPRVEHPLRWFGVAELLIGVAALATQPALHALTSVYVDLHPALANSPALLTTARFLGASLVLAVPTILMGASLPLVLQSSLGRDARVGARFALLYAANTTGAIVGTCLVGFVLIERVGIAASFQIAAAGNAFAGLAALGLSRVASISRRHEVAPASAPGRVQRNDRRILLVFAISGFAALAFEIVWFRLLVLFVPATTYAFSTMLAAVLFGIAAGSALVAPLVKRISHVRPLLAGVELVIGVAAMLSAVWLAHAYRAEWETGGTIQASLVTIVPTTLLMGLAFPLGVRLLTNEGGEPAAGNLEHAGRTAARVAVLYAVNVGGAIVGAIAAGFVLVPWLGTAHSLILVAALHVIAGLLLLDLNSRQGRIAAAVAILAFVAAATVVPDPVRSVLGRRYPVAERLTWREEGAQSTVSVHVRPGSGRQLLYLDGLHQASDSPELVHLHRLIGLLPMALHPHPKNALVIGLGAGATAGAVSQHANTQVTLVELSPSVVRASALFAAINHHVVDQPHVRVAINDARNHLLVTTDRYDVITADIIQPHHAGAGNLYSREYFTLVRNALADGGVALQWIGLREETPYRMILRTFLEVFPDATAWAGGTLLVAGRGPLRIDRRAFDAKLADPQTRAALEDVGLGSFDQLLRSYTAGPDELRRFAGAGPVLTDDRPRIEYFGSLPERERAINVRPLRGDVNRHVIEE
jgi:spermidine synthase